MDTEVAGEATVVDGVDALPLSELVSVDGEDLTLDGVTPVGAADGEVLDSEDGEDDLP